MRNKNTSANHRLVLPEEELRDFSLNEDLNQNFHLERNIQSKWEIQPWKNQHENPSESPERRPYFQKFPMLIPKQEKTSNYKPRRLSTNVLESMSNSIVLNRPKINKRNQSQMEIKDQEENRPVSKTQSFRRRSSTQRVNGQTENKEKEEVENYSYHQTPVNPILYPMITDIKKKRVFKKMDRFQNFLSVTLRK